MSDGQRKAGMAKQQEVGERSPKVNVRPVPIKTVKNDPITQRRGNDGAGTQTN